jgi:ribonuclease R
MAESRFLGVTIDAKQSRDLDDAIWVERDGSGWRVTVSITNVADAVPIGSPEDLAAQAIGFTRYARDSVRMSMLPSRLSEGALSLVPGQPRSVLAFVLAFSESLALTDVGVAQGVLENLGRLSHTEAGTLIEGGEPRLHRMMADAWQLASGLLDVRRRNGAFAFFSLSSGLATDEEGRLVALSSSGPVSRAAIIVQELMIAANAALAARFATAGIPLLFRNHRGNPVADRQSLRHDLEIAAIGGVHAEAAVRRMEMMLGRAELGAKALGHFGLNLPVYAWNTSPIRRYADLVNQRLILAALAGGEPPYDQEQLDAIAIGLNGIADREAEERAAALKAASERRAGRHLQGSRFGHLDGNDMQAVIKAASEDGFPESLLGEVEARLTAGQLSSKDMARLAFGSGPGAASARAALFRHLESDIARAVSILNYMEQTNQVTAVEWQEQEQAVSAAPFLATLRASIGGETVSAGPICGLLRKEARQRATTALLAQLAGADWAPPASWLPNEAAGEETAADTGSLAPTGDRKGALISLCSRTGLSQPSFEVEQDGPSHAPVFRAVASTVRKGLRVASVRVEAKTRKEAERLAATSLLECLGGIESPAPPRDDAPKTGATPGNAKGSLQERCMALGWPMPVYEVEQSGPPHAPAFRAVVRIKTPTGDVASENVTAGARKEAEKLAAAMLLRSPMLGGAHPN